MREFFVILTIMCAGCLALKAEPQLAVRPSTHDEQELECWMDVSGTAFEAVTNAAGRVEFDVSLWDMAGVYPTLTVKLYVKEGSTGGKRYRSTRWESQGRMQRRWFDSRTPTRWGMSSSKTKPRQCNCIVELREWATLRRGLWSEIRWMHLKEIVMFLRQRCLFYVELW